MELDSVHVVALQDGGVGGAVGAGGAGAGVERDVVTVGEVDVGGGRGDEFRLAADGKLIPAHVGDAHVSGEFDYCARINAEAAYVGGLFAGFEERLHAEADSEEGYAGLDALDQGIADFERVEGAHHLA